MKLSENQKKYLIELIENDQQIPEDFKYAIFPTAHEEYELTYAGKMRKEDLLANQDGTFPIPLQIEKVFNNDKYENSNDDWKNMIVFGDNLQFLKTIYENKDPLIKDKVKGKVKLIYIDPPFATQDEFQNKEGAKAYNDKKQGAEFLEFLRRRLIIAREILAEDGSIYVHIDDKMGHYVKAIMDEIFGKNYFKCHITWEYQGSWVEPEKRYPKRTQQIYYYTKSNEYIFNPIFEEQKTTQGVMKRWERYIHNGVITADNVPYNDGKFEPYINNFIKEHGREPKNKDIIAEFKGRRIGDMWYVPTVNPMSKENTKYPTQKPEALLERIIKTSTDKGDLVMDFFGGSGTTMSVAEKLNRRWIICDLGKLSYFAMQKRLLQIAESKDLETGEPYSSNPKSFVTAKLGVYDLEKTLNLDWEKYQEFVSGLFEFRREEVDINGVNFEGIKRGYPVKIFNYDKYSESAIDETYLRNILTGLASKAPTRVYIVSPASRVNFISDYEIMDNTKFYFLEVPYEMIKELHSAPFIKLRQPRSRNDVNDIEEMKGFQFNYNPDVSCKLVKRKNYIDLVVEEFKSYSIEQGEQVDFTTLSSIFVDYDYNGESFIMDDVRFWDEIESDRKTDNDTKLIKNNDDVESIVWRFKKDTLGENPIFIFSDTSGNDVVVKLSLEV